MARVNLVCAAISELDSPPFEETPIMASLGRALRGVTTVAEAQVTHFDQAIQSPVVKEQRAWLDELTPLTITWPGGRSLRLLYVDRDADDTGLRLLSGS